MKTIYLILRKIDTKIDAIVGGHEDYNYSFDMMCQMNGEAATNKLSHRYEIQPITYAALVDDAPKFTMSYLP